MKVTVQSDPFPLMIIEDLYTEEELNLIWNELDYYQSNQKILNSNTSPSVDLVDGTSRTEKKGLFVDYAFQDRSHSNILNVSRKLFEHGLIANSDHLLQWKYFQPDSDFTLLSYYDDGGYYLPHHDNTVVSVISWLWKEPKRFEGGDFVFQDYGVKLTCRSNCAVAFPGLVQHGVEPVTMKEEYRGKGLGRYSISHFMNFQ